MAEQTIDVELDLSGEVCPYTFIKSKMAIDALDPGKVLSVTVDNSESAGNVPRSLSGEGHEVLSVDKAGSGRWRIVVRNGGTVE
ncbi:MAG: sulfurtransferase TusA family protein [Spirochaetaceae bacterium]|nr:MAG: sulfurtransferase TusA family protein [Spirochaetaceae bacterium]